MLRKLNRVIHDFLREKRLKIGKLIFDRKNKSKIIESNSFIRDNNIQKILFLRYDGKIGDMVVNTFMFREIKKRFHDIKIGVVVRKENKEIVCLNPNVDKIYIYNKKNVKYLSRQINEEKYDLLIDFSEMLRVKQMQFIKECGCRINMGLNKQDWNLFDISIESGKDFQWDEHITKRYTSYLKKIGINENIDINYELFFKENKKYYDCFQINKGKDIVVINPYGASAHKSFTVETLKKVIEILENYDVKIVILYYGNKRKEIEQLEAYNKVYIPNEIVSILDTIEIISQSDLVITPDTSIVHIASALHKELIAVYPPNGGNFGVDHLVWAPSIENCIVLFCRDKSSTYDEIDINNFDMIEMEKNIKNFFIKRKVRNK